MSPLIATINSDPFGLKDLRASTFSGSPSSTAFASSRATIGQVSSTIPLPASVRETSPAPDNFPSLRELGFYLSDLREDGCTRLQPKTARKRSHVDRLHNKVGPQHPNGSILRARHPPVTISSVVNEVTSRYFNGVILKARTPLDEVLQTGVGQPSRELYLQPYDPRLAIRAASRSTFSRSVSNKASSKIPVCLFGLFEHLASHPDHNFRSDSHITCATCEAYRPCVQTSQSHAVSSCSAASSTSIPVPQTPDEDQAQLDAAIRASLQPC